MSIKEGSWTKVVYLKEGMEIAVSDKGGNEAVWDKISKIEVLPEEQVYDIEVDGTHNFIGNDIVAHNTYIGGSASAANLIVSNSSVLGTVSSGTWNATSIGTQYGGTGQNFSASSGLMNLYSGTASAIATSSLGLLTTNIAEGTNLYWTNDRFDNRLSATTTLPNITTLANLATVGTITSGTWNGTTIAVNKGGTGLTSFGQGWLNSDGTTLSASTSPTVAYITATSTTATSTFPLLKATTAFQLGTDYLTDITGTGLQITSNALTLNATGDWTGTFDGQEGTYYLARANHTGTQGISTLSNYDWTFANNYGVNNITGSTTMPFWAQGGLNASSTSRFVYASTTALTVSGNSYLGTVSSGTWNGTSIAAQYGGTGQNFSASSGLMNLYSGTASAIATSSLGLLTTDVAEGTNLYWTNDRFDNRLSATTSLQNIATLANLATVGTITSGTWGGTTIAVNKGGTV